MVSPQDTGSFVDMGRDVAIELMLARILSLLRREGRNIDDILTIPHPSKYLLDDVLLPELRSAYITGATKTFARITRHVEFLS